MWHNLLDPDPDSWVSIQYGSKQIRIPNTDLEVKLWSVCWRLILIHVDLYRFDILAWIRIYLDPLIGNMDPDPQESQSGEEKYFHNFNFWRAFTILL